MTHVGAQQDKRYRDILSSTGRISLPVVLGRGHTSGLSDGGWTSQGKATIGGEMGRIDEAAFFKRHTHAGDDVAVSCGTSRTVFPRAATDQSRRSLAAVTPTGDDAEPRAV
jgi:hypothetical protein